MNLANNAFQILTLGFATYLLVFKAPGNKCRNPLGGECASGACPIHSIKAHPLTLTYSILDLFSNYFIPTYPFSSTPPQSLHGQEFSLPLLIAAVTFCAWHTYANSQGMFSK